MNVYNAEFNLNIHIPKNRFNEAQEYLSLEMVEYFDYAKELNISSIRWYLTERNKGIIKIKSNNDLSKNELDLVSEFVSGQCSDGLGEGFEQQEFSEICDDCLECFQDCDCVDDDGNCKSEGFVFASFERGEKYIFLKQGD